MAIIPKGAIKQAGSLIKSGVDSAKSVYNDVESSIVGALKSEDLKRPDNLTPNEVNSIATQQAPEPLAKEALDNADRKINPDRHESRNWSLNSIDSPEDIKAMMDSPFLWDDDGIGALRKGKEPVLDIDGNPKLDADGEPLMKRKGSQTHGETLDKAFANSQTVNQWLKKGRSVRTAEELVRGKQLMLLGAQELAEAARAIKLSKGDLAKEYRFRALVAKQAALFHAFTGSVNETGRALNSLKITIGSDERMMAQMEVSMLQMGGTPTVQKMADAILSLGDDMGKITDFAVQNKYRRKTQAINEWISASHLWQPTTHMANQVGNISSTLTGVGERYAATAIGKARDLMSKAAGDAGVVDRVSIRESNAMVQGMIEGMISAPKIFAKAFRDAEKDQDFLMSKGAVKVDGYFKPAISADNLLGENMNSPWGKMIDAVAPWMIRMPFRMLGSADEVYKVMNYNMQSYAHSRRAALQEGLEYGSEEYNDKVNKILSGEDEVYSGVVNDNAIDYAEFNTFTNSLTDEFSRSVQSAASASPLVKMFLPYVRTPTNIVKFAMERTFLAPATKQWRDQWKKGGAERDIAASKVMLGSTIQAGVLHAMLNVEQVKTPGGTIEVPRPLITGAYPKSRAQQKIWQQNGIQPWSFYFGDGYHAYNRADPIGMQIGMMAQGVATAQSFNDPSARENAWMSVAVGLGEYFSDKTYFRSLGEMFNLFDSRNSSVSNFQRLAGQKVASFVIPSNLSWLAKQADNGFVATTESKNGTKSEHKFGTPEELNEFMERNPDAEVSTHPMMRETKTSGMMNNIIKQLMKRSPLHRKDLFPKVDKFGNDVILDSLDWHAYNMSGSRMSEIEHNDVLSNELFEQGYGYMEPNSKITFHVQQYDRTVDVDLVAVDPSGKMYYDWQKLVGKERYRLLSETIRTQNYEESREGSDLVRVGRRYWLARDVRLGREAAVKKFRNRYARELNKAGVELIESGGGAIQKPYTGNKKSDRLENNPSL